MFWPIVYSSIIIIAVLFLREVWLLMRLPKEYPDRGLYFFNVFFLFLCIVLVICGSYYLDARKAPLEALLPPYPAAVFVPDRSILNGGTIWVYEATANENNIVDFYKGYARERNKGIIIDSSNKDLMRMRIETDDAPLFLTIVDLGTVRELNYSFDGKVEMATTTPKG